MYSKTEIYATFSLTFDHLCKRLLSASVVTVVYDSNRGIDQWHERCLSIFLRIFIDAGEQGNGWTAGDRSSF